MREPGMWIWCGCRSPACLQPPCAPGLWAEQEDQDVRFFSLGVGAGLPVLSLSGCLSSKCVVFVAPHSLLRQFDFKHLIVKEKSLYENPPSPFHVPKKAANSKLCFIEEGPGQVEKGNAAGSPLNWGFLGTLFPLHTWTLEPKAAPNRCPSHKSQGAFV